MPEGVAYEVIVWLVFTGLVVWVAAILIAAARIISWISDGLLSRKRGPGLDEMDGDE